MIIVYSCSKLYEQYAKISIESVLKHNPNADIKIICREQLDLPFEQITIQQDKTVLDGQIHPSWEGSAKLYLEQLPYDKIIYLGADTICQGDLSDMWNKPCDYINACKTHFYGEQQAKELGIDFYINVDSMVLNLNALRQDNFKDKAFAIMQEVYKKVKLWCNEETMINYAFHNKIKLLPQEYNYAYNRKYLNPMPYNQAKILHFIGQDKGAMLRYSYDKKCNDK